MLKVQTAPAARTPSRGSARAAGLDLSAMGEGVIYPGSRWRINTGISVEIGEGFVGMVCSRSGLALNHGVAVLNAPGIIDADFRGEISVLLQNSGAEPWFYSHGDRIAQLLIVPVSVAPFELLDSLSETERGAGGFGSTGR